MNIAPAPLTPAERRVLLVVARDAIASRLDGREAPPLASPPGALLERRAAFVTLRLASDLRGCIGTTAADRPLVETVTGCAVAAATKDPRFPTLSRSDLDRVRIIISVLGPFRPVLDPAEIVAGRHGVMIVSGSRRGLLLPQVAGEEGWDRETLLAQACRKAGLAPTAWRGGARIEIFEAEVFAEADDPSQ